MTALAAADALAAEWRYEQAATAYGAVAASAGKSPVAAAARARQALCFVRLGDAAGAEEAARAAVATPAGDDGLATTAIAEFALG